MGRLRHLHLFAFWLVFFACTIVLSGCSSTKGDKEIVADLQASDEFIIDTVTIYNHSIIKRQTDTGKKTDIVYINVNAKNNDVSCNRSFQMTYTLYNDGWILDKVAPYKYEEWTSEPLHGVTEEDIQNYMQYSQVANGYSSIEVLNRPAEWSPGISNETITFLATKEHLYATEKITFSQTWYFNVFTYAYDYFDPQDFDRTYELQNSIIGAEWTYLPRRLSDSTLFENYDVKILDFDGAVITLMVTRQMSSIFPDRDPGESVAIIEVRQLATCPDRDYYAEDGRVGFPLVELDGKLCSKENLSNFDDNDYFFFDIDGDEPGAVGGYFYSDYSANAEFRLQDI